MRHAAFAALLSVALAPPLAMAQADTPVLTVYTYSSFSGEYGPGATIEARFEEVCGCDLRWVASDDSGTLLARLKLEGASTPADIVLGLDTSLMAQARASGLFAPHQTDLSGLDLPVAWSDDTFVPFDWGWFAFVYDETRLATPPASLADLVADEDGPTLVIEDPRTSSPGLGLLLWMRDVYGEDAAEAWKKLSPRIVTVTRGWSEAYGLFLDGEADMVLSYTTSPAYHIAAEDETKYKAAIFPEGHYLQVEVAALVESSQNKELGRRFLDFMVSDAVQSAIPEGNWMYPAATPEAGLPASFAALDEPGTSLFIDPVMVDENRRAWIDDWLAAMDR